MSKPHGSSARVQTNRVSLPKHAHRPDGLSDSEHATIEGVVANVAATHSDVPLGSTTLSHFLADLRRVFRQALRDRKIGPSTGKIDPPLWDYAMHLLWTTINTIRQRVRGELHMAEEGPRLFGRNSLAQWTSDRANRGWDNARYA